MPRLRFLLPLLAVFLLTGITGKVLSRYASDQRIARITWKAACRISNYEVCPKSGPAVRRSPIIGEVGARGAYWMGSPVIWLDPPMVKGTQMWLTIFHEQVHYLQYLNGVDSEEGFDKILRCLVEREALDFTNAYAIELKAPTLVRSVQTWRKLYNCGPTAFNSIGMSHQK